MPKEIRDLDHQIDGEGTDSILPEITPDFFDIPAIPLSDNPPAAVPLIPERLRKILNIEDPATPPLPTPSPEQPTQPQDGR